MGLIMFMLVYIPNPITSNARDGVLLERLIIYYHDAFVVTWLGIFLVWGDAVDEYWYDIYIVCFSRQYKLIVRIQYFVRGGFVGHLSRASSKHLSPSSSGRRARFLRGSNRGCVAPADARVGVGSTKKAD
ncbi:hypothetical protein TNCV_2843231 [Trichonephila clavipes]|nr:hypothetical protein TNCV_2843231 [Trichonephila clavipes]